jgi:CRP-like cAMP-binding protein
MSEKQDEILPVVQLRYAPGEQIVKEGDYGISIYQIVDGEVTVFTGAGKQEVVLATLGPGEIFGEMVFLSGDRLPRSASARALKEVVLEAWHPSRIQQEYKEMPFIIRSIANQTVSRLKQMNRVLTELAEQHQIELALKEGVDAAGGPARPFRKEVQFDCLYLPAESNVSQRFYGKLRNISHEGLRMEANKDNAKIVPHNKGSMFIGSFFLPDGKRFTFRVAIVNYRVLPDNRTLSFGCIFVGLSETQKRTIARLIGP